MDKIESLIEWLLTQERAPWWVGVEPGEARPKEFSMEILASGGLAAVAGSVNSSLNLFKPYNPDLALVLGACAPILLAFASTCLGLRPNVDNVTRTLTWLTRVLAIHLLLLTFVAYAMGPYLYERFTTAYEGRPSHVEIYRVMPWWGWLETYIILTGLMVATIIGGVWLKARRRGPRPTSRRRVREEGAGATLVRAFTLYFLSVLILYVSGIASPATPWWVQPFRRGQVEGDAVDSSGKRWPGNNRSVDARQECLSTSKACAECRPYLTSGASGVIRRHSSSV